MWESPQSVEEAGALLGAAITKCDATSTPTIPPPKGMHSSFCISETIPSSELFTRLYQLRALLVNAKSPLSVAPSLLAVLMKLLSVSSTMAANSSTTGLTPPLWSTALRTLWVDCVVACHTRCSSSSTRTLLALATLHPKSIKAAGGTRLSALLVLQGMWLSNKHILDASPYDVLVVCQRALKSSGQGAPTFRMAAVKTACAVATHCQRRSKNHGMLLLVGAMEDVALIETVTVIRLASADKYPEVRGLAATCCCILAPMLITNNKNSNNANKTPEWLLEEVLTFCYKQLDDEQNGVATQWTEAMARLLTTLILHHDQTPHSKTDTDQQEAMRFSTRTKQPWASCTSILSTISYLVDAFSKAGGEWHAARLGSPYSAGGRGVRLGLSLTLIKLLNIHISTILANDQLEQVIMVILSMVGVEKQFLESNGLNVATEKASSLFSTPKKSPCDAGLARMATNRVLREGLIASEATQLKVLQILMQCLADVTLNSHQRQVCLIEISHLLTTLGQAAESSVMDLIPILKSHLLHVHHGVRHETAISCAALGMSFPIHGRKLFRDTIDDIQVQHAELVTLASLEEGVQSRDVSPKSRFRRKEEEKKVDASLAYQYAIHGQALAIAVLLRELPRLPGGLPQPFMAMAMSVAEILVCTQGLDHLTKRNPGGVCTCVQAGYGILSGGLTVGANHITCHIALIFGLWQKVEVNESKHLTPDQDLICLDAALASIVSFLEHCSEVLLAVPDALSRTTMLLEQMLPLFLPSGPWETLPVSPAAKSRYESAKASIMEAYAWLPPGSYPMIANEVFSFALAHIQAGIEAEVTCSILPTLVNNEDRILDTKSLCRAQHYWQVCGAREIEDNLITLNSEAVHHGERESVLHFQTSTLRHDASRDHRTVWGSHILGLLAHDGKECQPPPTQLHEVGTWRRPISPSSSSKIRLLDAAVQAFSATFGLKDGKEQQHAMLLLESLVPPILAQLARAIGVNTALIEPDRRTKMKEDNAAIANITAVLLSCLKALPLHEATHDIPIGLGPPWMNKAKDLLLTLLPSTSNIVRRAASEGLALLATLGVTEDAHTLQSTVLHSLDEVMQGNKPDGKPRTIPLESISAARAGSLLTLACIQRTAFNIRGIHRARRGRSYQGDKPDSDSSDALPTIQMMTRILPSVACHGAIRDAFVVRTYAMHAFTLLIAYSTRLTRSDPSDEDKHLLRKGVEMVEDNFLSCWTAVSADTDQGQEPGNLAAEASFLSVLLRTMSFLTPHVGLLADTDDEIAARFSRIAVMIVEDHGRNPVVLAEGLAFFEILSENQGTTALTDCVPYVLECLKPNISHAVNSSSSRTVTLSSAQALRAGVMCARLLVANQVIDIWASNLPSILFSLLESIAGSRTCTVDTYYRSLAVSRDADIGRSVHSTLEVEICTALDAIIFSCGTDSEASCQSLVRWVLLSRPLVVGIAEQETVGLEENAFSKVGAIAVAVSTARADTNAVFDVTSLCRWQVRCQATRCATIALQELALNTGNINQYEPSRAVKELQRQQAAGAVKPPTFLVFHLTEILSAASAAVVATIDQSDIRQLQEGGVHLLKAIVTSFGGILDPDDPGVSILEQYSSQVLSAAKYAVSAGESEPVSYTVQLAGCNALVLILKKGLIVDQMVFKRIVKPILPTNLSFAEYGSTNMGDVLRPTCSDAFIDQRSLVLPLITKLSCMARIRGMIANGTLAESVAAFLVDETESSEVEIGVHSAALAIDGARLLREATLCLCGSYNSVGNDDTETQGDDHDHDHVSIVKPGFLFANIDDIDDATKAALTSSWATCAFQASLLLSKHSTEGDKHEAACKQWLNKLLPLLFVGFKDASQFIDHPHRSPIAWANGVSPEETMMCCLHGLRLLMDSNCVEISQNELAVVITTLSELVLFPSVGLKTGGKSSVKSDDLVSEACKFMQSVAAANVDVSVHSALLHALLIPLDAVQQHAISFEMRHAPSVIIALLNAIACVVNKSSTQDTLVNAMLQLSLDILSQASSPEGVRNRAESLLSTCFATDAITPARQATLACDMASQGKWEAWCTICSRSEDALKKSIHILADALGVLSDVTRHVGAIASLRSILLHATNPLHAVGIAMEGAGAQVIGLFMVHGQLAFSSKEAMTHRLAICADCMKILMVSYNQLFTGDEAVLVAFVTVVFECWVGIIQYNGLPNQASPQSGADAMLGKMSAQAIMHVARTSPSAFKASMGGLSDHCRAILEFAVRSDMSGYANANATTPVKKKLDLKSFKK